MTFKITVNGSEHTVSGDTSIAALLDKLGVRQGRVAVERNRRVVPRAAHDATVLENGDVLEVVAMVGGGV